MKHVCEFNENGYIIDGKPVWLATGEFQYFRLTRGEWRKRLLQLKLAGFNTISAYFAWNYHEVVEGHWDFAGDKDVEAFLKIAAELGLYVIARPGPYICNEWECGGIPAWLSMRPGIRLRTADPQYLNYCDKWWDKIVPIIAKYQLGKEGTIILVQVENEYGHAGEHQEADYIYHLRDGLRTRGITVPLINCDSFIRHDRILPRKWEGINLCCNGGGDGLRMMDRARKMQKEAPLFVTEFWIAAFDWWGRNESGIYSDERAVYGALEMAAGGAGGVNMFVFSGGANFAYWSGRSILSDNNFISTLYGPGAPIMEDGRLSSKYYRLKREFTGLMAASEELAKADMPKISGDINGLCKAVRKSENALFSFYINHSKEQMKIADEKKEQGAVDFAIPAGMVRWSVEHLLLKSGFVLEHTTGNLFVADPALVIYAKSRDRVSIKLRDPETGEEILLEKMVREDTCPVDWHVVRAGKELTVLLVSEEAVDACYRIELPGQEAVLLEGLKRIENLELEGSTLRVTGYQHESYAWKADRLGYGGWQPEEGEKIKPFRETIRNPVVSCRFEEAEQDFDDSDWFAAEMPQPMARFGSGNGWAWYRTEIQAETDGWQMIFPSGASDRWMYFVDGIFCASRGAHTKSGENVQVYLKKGVHCLAILAENLGMYNTGFEMNIPMGEPKGLYGSVWLNGNEIKGWRMREGLSKGAALTPQKEAERTGWQAPKVTQCSCPCFVKGSFRCPENFEGAVRIHMEKAGKGSIWVNGFHIGRYWNIGPQQSIWIPLDKLKEENEIVLFEQEKMELSEIFVEYVPYGRRTEVILEV